MTTKAIAGSETAQDPIGRASSYAELEAGVTKVWKEVLDIDNLDPNSNFFNVGGTSLTAMRVVGRLRKLHGTLSIKTFMSGPTITELAKALDRNRPDKPNASTETTNTPSPQTEAQQTFPLTRAQENLWQIANFLPGLPVFSVPGALLVEGPLDIDLLGQTLAYLSSRHDALRTRIDNTAAGPVQVVEPDSGLKFKLIDLQTSRAPTERCEERMAIEVLKPIELSRAPLGTFIVFQLTGEQHVIFINMHHIVCDGWSLGQLLTETAQIYRQLSMGNVPPSLPDSPMGCGELAKTELDWANTRSAGLQRQYWLDRLAPPWPGLAGDNRFGRHEDPGLMERMKSERYRRPLAPDVIQALSRASREHSVTEFMVVLAAVASTLRSWSGQEDLRIATMMANRVQAERDSAVGLMANTVILRLNVDEHLTAAELVRQARDVCTNAFERQELPFEDVQASLNARYPATSRNGPLFEVMLLVQEETDEITNDQDVKFFPYRERQDAIKRPATPTMCDLVLVSSKTTAGDVDLELQFVPAITAKSKAEVFLEEVAAAISATAQALMAHE